jgi:hypothetical protein
MAKSYVSAKIVWTIYLETLLAAYDSATIGCCGGVKIWVNALLVARQVLWVRKPRLIAMLTLIRSDMFCGIVSSVEEGTISHYVHHLHE